jgi:uncharacterized protein (TIGR02246 family)
MRIDDAERDRRRRLMEAHVAAENDHDLEAIMATFADDAELIFNSNTSRGYEQIASGHALIGMTSQPGAIEDLRCVNQRIFFTDAEIIVEARVEGKFVRPFGNTPPTNQQVSLRGFNAYLFDDEGKLVRERAVLNLGVLGPRGR